MAVHQMNVVVSWAQAAFHLYLTLKHKGPAVKSSVLALPWSVLRMLLVINLLLIQL